METEKLKRKLIKDYLEGWKHVNKSSAAHYVQSGRISGSLFLTIKDMMDEYAKELNPFKL